MTSEGQFDCRNCDETLRKERGHDSEGIMTYHYGGESFKRCPLMMITSVSWEYIRAFNFFEKGFLPNGQAINEESNKYLDAMMFLDNEFSKWKNKTKK